MKRDFYPIDSSALAYPLMRTKRAQSNFRFSVQMKSKVDPVVLGQSLADVLNRYPVLKTTVKPAFFWHVLRKNDAPFVVKEDDRPPLTPFLKEDTNGYPFRLAYCGNEIIFEVFHAATDGNVGALFISDLLTRYAEIKDGAAETSLPERELVFEDAFLRYGEKKPFRDVSLKKYNGESVFAIGKTGRRRPYPELLSVEIPLAELKAAAKEHGATITEYVAACYVIAILEGQPLPLKKSVCLFVPIDLRKYFPSRTMQNFVCFERIYLKKGENDLSFSHVLSVVRKEFASKVTKESMKDHVDDVYRCFTLPVVKYSPLFVKYPFFKLVKTVLNKVRQTAILSNVGAIPLSESAERYVKNVKFFLNIGKNAPMNLAIATCNGICNIDVTNGMESRDIPERFFRLLTTQGKK